MTTTDLEKETGVAPENMEAPAATKMWRWMGNYGDVYGPVNAANSVGAGPGAIHCQIMTNGLVATWLYY